MTEMTDLSTIPAVDNITVFGTLGCHARGRGNPVPVGALVGMAYCPLAGYSSKANMFTLMLYTITRHVDALEYPHSTKTIRAGTMEPHKMWTHPVTTWIQLFGKSRPLAPPEFHPFLVGEDWELQQIITRGGVDIPPTPEGMSQIVTNPFQIHNAA